MAKQPTITLTFTLDQYDAIQRAVIAHEETDATELTREERIAAVCEDWAGGAAK